MKPSERIIEIFQENEQRVLGGESPTFDCPPTVTLGIKMRSIVDYLDEEHEQRMNPTRSDIP